jgi:glycosyltransferase involved in cell wall biosynthesis
VIPPSGAPVLSVVLSTYNRAVMLSDAVRALLAVDRDSPPHEIIVVDNNSADETRPVVEALLRQAGGRLRYAFEPEQGLSHARNRGIADARGRYVAFTDDDVRVEPGWVRATVAAFERHPEADFVGGRVLPDWPSAPPEWLADRTWGHWAPLALVDYGDTGFVTSAQRPFTFVGANMAYRREVFAEFGGFDPRFQHAPGSVSSVEDHAFELRLYQAGRRGWYEPSMVMQAAVQPDRLTRAYHRRWARDHGRALMRMLPSGHYFDAGGLPRADAPGARRLLNVPRFMYAAAARAAARAVGAAARGHASWFRAECELRELLGSMRELASVQAASGARPDAGAPAESRVEPAERVG